MEKEPISSISVKEESISISSMSVKEESMSVVEEPITIMSVVIVPSVPMQQRSRSMHAS